jgi:peptidoglycan/LPS O-acetylase OafA/YrhL
MRVLDSPSVASASRSIPSLDGLRACSVAMVIVSHYLAYGSDPRFRFPRISWLGFSGVDVFFVISGFLITGLLVRESDKTGNISLRNFYFRRFFRIFPPFYVFMLVIAILWAKGIIATTVPGFVSAATYTSNYWGAPNWILAHTWSLGLEEQFYVLWPPCLALLGKRKSTWVALGLIVLEPAIRFVSYVVAPSLRGAEGTMLHTRIDMIMFGCAIALLWEHPLFHKWVERFLHPALFAFAALYVVVFAPLLSGHFEARFDWTVGYTLRGLMISLVLLYAVKRPASLAGKFLNLGFMRHFGVISYSIYLWQQPFMGGFAGLPLPLNVLPALGAAELSHWLVERPSFWLRDRVAARWNLGKSKLPAGAAVLAKQAVGEAPE